MDDPKDLKSGLSVAGYRPQSDAAIALVNDFKADEERLLRKLDAITSRQEIGFGGNNKLAVGALEIGAQYDQRWLAIAKSHFEQGFMALNRAVFQPARVKLPEEE